MYSVPAHRRPTWAAVGRSTGSGEAGLEVGDDVLDRLQADRQPHETGLDAGGHLLLLGELRVGGGRRMDGEAADVADVGHVAVQRQGVDEARAGLLATLDDEGGHRA